MHYDEVTDDPRDLNPASLRNIAEWLDTYDQLAGDYFSILEKAGQIPTESLRKARGACNSDEIQRDLRRWADELEVRS